MFMGTKLGKADVCVHKGAVIIVFMGIMFGMTGKLAHMHTARGKANPRRAYIAPCW